MTIEVREHEGVLVVRDDLFPGGTKARFAASLYDDPEVEEVVYATPAQGGAQIALATVARARGKRAVLFVAQSKAPHPATAVAASLGAVVHQVPMGFLSHVQKRAAAYVEATDGAILAPFGFDVPGACEAIADAARSSGVEPDEVWCAASSGTLARGLALAFPAARRHVVQIGRRLSPEDVDGATIHVHPRKYEQPGKVPAPFSANENYETKAWELCLERKGQGVVLFWNVVASARDLLEASAT